jgi:hypothetical protein
METPVLFRMHGGCPRPGVWSKDAHLCHHSATRQEASSLSSAPGFADCRLRGHINRAKYRVLPRVNPPHAATPHRFGNQRDESVPPSLTPLTAFTDYLGRFVVHAPWLLCAGTERSPKGPARKSIRDIRHCRLQKCGLFDSSDAELAFSDARANGKNVVPLDPHVLLFSMFIRQT